jgi:hypothetical protein
MRKMTTATETPDKASLLHHMATVAAEQEVTIRTIDGKSATGKFDAVFADGLSLMVHDHKLYFPLKGIMWIAVHPPKDASRPKAAKRSIASMLAH